MSPPRAGSLRRSLLVWLVLPLAVAVAVGAVTSYRAARDAADLAYDRTLLTSARGIAERMVAEDGQLAVDLPYAAIDVFQADQPGRVFHRVTGVSGEFLSGFDDFPPLPPGTPRSALYPALVHFYDCDYHGTPLRAAALFEPVSGPGPRGMAVVYVGETLEARRSLARTLLVETLAQQALLLVLLAVATVVAVHRALAPVRRLREDVGRRPASDLEPVDEARVHRELRPLVAALNQHIGRVRGLVESRRRFIADAAHQLRTPLAALKTQAEMALRSGSGEGAREAVEAVVATTDETVRLANQLLSLARAEPQAGAAAHEAVALDAVARQVCLDRSPDALRAGVDLAFEAGPATVRGDPVLLRELVTNLVENALRYGAEGGAVTVRARAGADGRAALEVEDAGRGIPAALRGRVLERFYRVPGETAPGSGLGLAIVKEIAAAHGAAVELVDALPSGSPRPGLRVTVTFPPAGAPRADGPAPA
jgi:two-component system sensor histidine kinase TctE